VFADDGGHRALPAWLADDPWATPLPALLDRSGGGTWATAGVPEAFAARLVSEAGGSVTAVEVHPVVPDPGEVSSQTCAARIEFDGPAGGGHVTARLDLGLVLATVAGAPVRVPGGLMDRLAVPVPGDDPLAPFGRPPAGWERKEGVIIDRAGRVLQVAGVLPGKRPRFEPRNTEFRDGLDRQDLDGRFGQEARPGDYSAVVEGRCAMLSSAVPEPRGSAVLVQAVFADDFRGAVAVFRGQVRTADVADGDLVRLARDGDPVAFRLLVERYRPMVRARAPDLGAHPADLDDVAQESFLQAFLALERLRDPDRFAAWLAGIVLNVWRSLVRRAPVTLLPDWPEQLHPAASDGLPSADDLDRADALRAAMADLPAGQRSFAASSASRRAAPDGPGCSCGSGTCGGAPSAAR
jgi:hypothetical protein